MRERERVGVPGSCHRSSSARVASSVATSCVTAASSSSLHRKRHYQARPCKETAAAKPSSSPTSQSLHVLAFSSTVDHQPLNISISFPIAKQKHSPSSSSCHHSHRCATIVLILDPIEVTALSHYHLHFYRTRTTLRGGSLHFIKQQQKSIDAPNPFFFFHA